MEAAGFQGLMRALNIDDSRLAPYDAELGSSYAQLATLKATIEAQLTVLASMLTSLGADMDTPLVRDGFPRSDIDVVGVRLVRVRILRLQNDLQRVCERLAQAMEVIFASGKVPTLNGHVDADERHDDTDERHVNANERHDAAANATVPFAVVTDVDPRGPAFLSGLRDQDLIVSVDGDINSTNHRQLAVVAARVRSRLGAPVNVVVLRNGDPISLTVVPSPWEGPGLLGCRLVLF